MFGPKSVYNYVSYKFNPLYYFNTCFVIYFFLLEFCCHLFVEHQYTNSFSFPHGECPGRNIAAWQRVPGPCMIYFF